MGGERGVPESASKEFREELLRGDLEFRGLAGLFEGELRGEAALAVIAGEFF